MCGNTCRGSWVCVTDTEMDSLTTAADILNIELYVECIHKIEAEIDRDFIEKSIILQDDSTIRF